MRKSIAAVLILAALMGVAAIPVNASLAYSEDPMAQKDYVEFGSSLVETEPMQTAVPETLCLEETVPPATEEPAAVEPAPQEEHQTEETVPAAEPEAPKEKPADAPRGHNGVPLYFQTDYPNNIYGVGTIANNGCSAASLAMVATYLTGHEYLPDEIARYFGGAAENNIARLETGSEQMQLPFKKAKDWHETLAALYDGKIAIVLMGADSLFTDSQHFIVVTGFNEDGKLMVNDSYEPNYSKWDIKKGLRNGFDKEDIMLGYSGAWIYDKDAMPEEPFLYSEPEPVRGEPRYGVELTWEEIQLIAKVVWVEAQGESNEGQQAVAEVILNRLVSDDFPDTVRGVVYAENQFRSAKFLDTAKPYQLQYEMVENALYGPYVLSDDVYYFATTPKTEKIWGKIGGHYFCYADN